MPTARPSGGEPTLKIGDVPGVVSASVDYESRNAVVRHDGREDMAIAVIKAVEEAGFSAELRR